MGHMLHFAYGQDLRRAEFLRICPKADWFGPALLEHHGLVFDPAGQASFKAGQGLSVWGVLWLVPSESLIELDAQAGAGFERVTRPVISPAGPRIKATTYVASSKNRARPSAATVAALVAGARENKLPASYVKMLQAVSAAD